MASNHRLAMAPSEPWCSSHQSTTAGWRSAAPSTRNNALIACASLLTSLFGEPIPKGDGFEFDAHCVRDWNHWASLEHKRRQHGAELVNGCGIITIQHHITTPVTHSDDEQLDLEIGWSLPLSENLQNALLGILVFYR